MGPSRRHRMDSTATIPDELLLLIFDLLRQPALLRAARVSRRWRLAARSHPDYYRHISLKLDPGRYEKADSLLAAWVRVADECLALGTPVGVRADVIECPMPDRTPEGITRAETILQKIHDLLGQTVHLRLVMDGVDAATVLAALSSPAPDLRSLDIALYRRFDVPLEDIPAPLLAGCAPSLVTLRLFGVPLNHTQKHPAFRGVRNVSISPSSHALFASLPETFPSVVTLDVHDMDYEAPTLPPGPRPRHLRAITARCSEHVPPLIVQLIHRLPTISVYIELSRQKLSWTHTLEPLVVALPDALQLRIKQPSNRRWELSICSSNTERTLYVPNDDYLFRRSATDLLLWSEIRPLHARLRALEIDVSMLVRVTNCLSVEFGGLEELAITFAPCSQSEAVPCWLDFVAWVHSDLPLRCPRLASLSLSWCAAMLNARCDLVSPPLSQAALLRLARTLHAHGPIELHLSGVRPKRSQHGGRVNVAFNSVFHYAGNNWVRSLRLGVRCLGWIETCLL